MLLVAIHSCEICQFNFETFKKGKYSQRLQIKVNLLLDPACLLCVLQTPNQQDLNTHQQLQNNISAKVKNSQKFILSSCWQCYNTAKTTTETEIKLKNDAQMCWTTSKLELQFVKGVV